MQITWLGHGTVELRFGEQVIVIDPWLENPSFPAGYEFQKCDTILVTHGHFDHITGVLPLARPALHIFWLTSQPLCGADEFIPIKC